MKDCDFLSLSLSLSPSLCKSKLTSRAMVSNGSSTLDTLEGQLTCPLLEVMKKDSLGNNTKVNMAVVCIHGLVSCLGILENALIIWVVGFRLQRRTVASIWVLNLAMSDFLATLTLPLFTLYFYNHHSWVLGNTLCKIEASIFFLNMFVSAFLLAAISLDRCLLVAKPVWSQNHRSVAGAWKVCAVGWLWAAANALPYFLFRSVIYTADERKLCYHNFALYASSQATLDTDCKAMEAGTAISKLLLAFLFPLVVIIGSYIQFFVSLRKRGIKRNQSTYRVTDALIMSNRSWASGNANTPTTTKTTNTFLKPQASNPASCRSPVALSSITAGQTNLNQLSQSFTKMVAFVIAAFVLCWAPYHIFCILEVAGHFKLAKVGLPLATTFAFLNPLLNPILYVFSCPNFCVRIRQSLAAVFDGLVEERGGTLTVPGKGLRAHIRRKSSRDASLGTPGSPQGSSPDPPLGRESKAEPEHPI